MFLCFYVVEDQRTFKKGPIFVTLQIHRTSKGSPYHSKSPLMTLILRCIGWLTYTVFGAALFGQTLSFSFVNPLIVPGGSTGQQVQFDVHLSCNVAGTWQTSGALYLNYSTGAYGSSVKANNRVTVTPLTLLPASYTVSAADFNASTLSINWYNLLGLLGNQPDPGNFRQIPTTATPLCRVNIDLQNPGATLTIAFDAAKMDFDEPFIYLIPTTAPLPPIAAPYPGPYVYSPPLNLFTLNSGIVSFEARWLDELRAQLQWQLEEDLKPAAFSLERSGKDQNFNTLAALTPASGQFVDAAPLDGPNHYRLRLVNANGESRYSNTLLLWREAPAREALQIAWAPDSKRLLIRSGDSSMDYCSAEVYDISGRLILREAYIRLEGGNASLELKNLESGLYTCRAWTTEGLSGSGKWVVE